MNRFLYYIIVVLILLVLFPMGTHAQDIDKLSENKVVTAVTALNSGDIDSAIRLLEASIEMSPENDAAYYYLSLCHASKKDMAKAETFMKNLRLIAIETHVADARSCCLHPASTTHRQMNLIREISGTVTVWLPSTV